MEEEIFQKILEAGIRAPSGDNIQPWKIKVGKNRNSFKLIASPEKTDFFDINNSATFISCGAFLENIEVAARNFGYKVKISLNNNQESLIAANVLFSKTKKKNTYYEEIFLRATLRTPFKSKTMNEAFFNNLKNIKSEYKDISLIIIGSKDKEIQKIFHAADVIRLATKKAHKTLYGNVRFNKKQISKREGIDYRTLGIPFAQKIVARLLSSWTLAKFFSATRLNRLIAKISATKLIKKSSGTGIITIKGNSKKGLINSGRFLQKIWLITTKHKGYIQPFAALPLFIKRIKEKKAKDFSPKQINQIIRLSLRLRKRLKIKEKEQIVMAFRFGISKPPKIKTLRKEHHYFIE